MVNKNGVQKNQANKPKKAKPKSKQAQSQVESPNQSEANNCFFGYYIKDYIKDFYAQKEESDQESMVESNRKKNARYSSSDSETDDSDDEKGNYKKKVIKNCDKLKKKSKKKMHKLINYSRDHWNLFNNNESDYEGTKKGSKGSKKFKKLIDEEGQHYSSNQDKSWSIYVWRSIFISGCVFLFTGLLMSISFLLPDRQVVVSEQEEMEIVDYGADKYNEALKQAKSFSLVLISIGLFLFVSTILLPQLVGVSLNCFKKQKDQTLASFFNSKDDSDNEVLSKVYVKCDKNNNKKEARKNQKLKKINEPIEDNISKIPILEEIQSVQPQREKDESILTSDGFAKLQ